MGKIQELFTTFERLAEAYGLLKDIYQLINLESDMDTEDVGDMFRNKLKEVVVFFDQEED